MIKVGSPLTSWVVRAVESCNPSPLAGLAWKTNADSQFLSMGVEQIKNVCSHIANY
jgi:hypothetical protein